MNISTVLDHVPEDFLPSESTELSTTVNKNKLRWKSTAAATTKMLLRGVMDSADAFGPLKSVAGGLSSILDNVEVWSSSHTVHNAYKWPGRRRQIDKR